MNNEIKSLPSKIGNLINLQILDCSNNQIESLPSEIGNLVNLRELYCNNNPINYIPPNVMRLIQRLVNNVQNIYTST